MAASASSETSDSDDNTPDQEHFTLFARSVLAYAKESLRRRKYESAFSQFLLFVNLQPDAREAVKDDFLLAMKEWTWELEAMNRLSELFTCFDQACSVFPDYDVLLNNIGAQLFRLDYRTEAVLYVRKALELNPDYLAARDNLDNITSTLVERWHFRMLNDRRRNQAFQRALRQLAARREDKPSLLLDIGAGTGLLSLYAHSAGIPRVYACEQNPVMAEVAREVIRNNGREGGPPNVQLLSKASTELSLLEDLPCRASDVVTEIFDAALFGEGILPTLNHAWHYLLEPPDSSRPRVIPGKATLYATAIQCEALRTQTRLLTPCLYNLDLHSLRIVCTTGQETDEPYTTANLAAIRGGFKQLSESRTILSVDFNNPQQISRLIKGWQATVTLPVLEDGRVDAIAVWFDLELAEGIFLSTAPSRSNCWEQAIFPVLPKHLHNCSGMETFLLAWAQDSTIQCHCELINGRFAVKCRAIETTPSRPPTLPPRVLRTEAPPTPPPPRPPLPVEQSKPPLELVLDSETISRLNDFLYIRAYRQAIQRVKAMFGDEHLSALEVTSSFSPLALMAADLDIHSLQVFQDCDYKEVIRQLWEDNPWLWSTLDCWTQDEEAWKKEAASCKLFLSDLVEPQGVLRQHIFEDIAFFRLEVLHEDAVVVPGKVQIWGMCVESTELLHQINAVQSNMLGPSIAEYINVHQPSCLAGIDLHALEYKALTEPFLMMEVDLNAPLGPQPLLPQQQGAASNPDKSPGDSWDGGARREEGKKGEGWGEEGEGWGEEGERDQHRRTMAGNLSQTRRLQVEVTTQGVCHAVLYWFHLVLVEGLELQTFRQGLHWRQAAATLPHALTARALTLRPGKTLGLTCMLKESCVRVDVSLPLPPLQS